MNTDIISTVRTELKKNIDPATRDSAKRFFKEEVKFYGVKSAVAGKIAADAFRSIKDKSKEEIFILCEELLKSDYSEEAFIAFEWSYRVRERYTPADFKVFERWVATYVNNWAKCDTICNHTIGEFVERYPQYVEKLKAWAVSKNRWVKRAAAFTLILPARRGLFLKDIFHIADTLLHDEDDLVQKGYGWMLKEASRKHQEDVFRYIMKHKATMPRTALRYAIEKMPEELKRRAMAK
jgi:3-methyladenine DNA glycosylase AlkD